MQALDFVSSGAKHSVGVGVVQRIKAAL